MQRLAVLPLFFALTACTGSLPEPPERGEALNARSLMEGQALAFCDVEAGDRQCGASEAGLRANGVGGLFLPLLAEVTGAELGPENGSISLKVNTIPGACAEGRVDWASRPDQVILDGVYCNWLAIGNVFTNITITVDWAESPERFGGRYAIGFNGTGNGSGGGYFVAEPSAS
ncbi:MAG: hypothetical protein AAGF13_09100 [Pseudomonadota bacterium]